MFTDLCD